MTEDEAKELLDAIHKLKVDGQHEEARKIAVAKAAELLMFVVMILRSIGMVHMGQTFLEDTIKMAEASAKGTESDTVQ